MNKLLRTELFNLLIEKSKEEVNNNVMQNAYDEFIEKIRDISRGCRLILRIQYL